MAISRRSFKGAGSIHLGPYDGSAGLFPAGNVSEATRSIATEEDSVTDHESVVGGIAAYDETVTSVEMELTCYNFAPAMLALATLGTSSTVAAGAAVDEQVTGWRNALVPFSELPDPAVNVVVEAKDGKDATAWTASSAIVAGSPYRVPTAANTYYYKATTTGTTGATQPTWPTTAGATVVDGGVTWTCMGKITKAENTDYTRDRSGIQMADTVGACESGRVLLVDYTRLAGSAIEVLTAPGKFWKLFLSGANRAEGGKPVTLRGHKCKISAADSLPSISDKFASFKLKVKFLRDDAIVGTGLSNYITERWGD